jgi:hypothetical protein
MTDDESSKRLQQLIRLKRHETPPPGYFNEFSDGVLDRIRDLESKRAVPWWRRWFSRGLQYSSSGSVLESGFRPVWVWNAAIGLSTLVIVAGGLYWASLLTDPEKEAGDPLLQAASSGNALSASSAASTVLLARSMSELVEPRSVQFRPVTVSMSGSSTELSSTNPLPSGLFQLPGASGGGSEAYRVRFGNSPR